MYANYKARARALQTHLFVASYRRRQNEVSFQVCLTTKQPLALFHVALESRSTFSEVQMAPPLRTSSKITCGDDPANESPGNIIANTNISADTLPNANKTLDEDDHMDIQGNTKLIEA